MRQGYVPFDVVTITTFFLVYHISPQIADHRILNISNVTILKRQLLTNTEHLRSPDMEINVFFLYSVLWNIVFVLYFECRRSNKRFGDVKMEDFPLAALMR